MANPVTKQMLLDGFHECGLDAGDMVVMHSSIRSFGHVGGGPDTVIDAALECVEPGGTVFMPVMTFGHYFNHRLSQSQCGLISETFRHRPGVIRSESPTHSIAGVGPDAARILAGHDVFMPDGPNGPGSPLSKLVDDGGLIMLLGVTHISNTTIHLIFSEAGIPFLEDWREVEVSDENGNITLAPVRHAGCSNGFDSIEPYLIEKKAQKLILIGDAEIRYMKASDVIELGIDAVREKPDLLLCDDPECRFCAHSRKMM